MFCCVCVCLFKALCCGPFPKESLYCRQDAGPAPRQAAAGTFLRVTHTDARLPKPAGNETIKTPSDQFSQCH